MKSVLFKMVSVCAVLLMMAGAGSAQLTSKRSLNLDGARKVIDAATAEAKRLNAPGGVIAVVDDGGNLISLERLDGTFSAGANISVGKAKTAVMFKRPTKFFEDVIKNGRTAMVALPDFTPLQGGVPILVDGQVVGGVGVSGAASAQQDEELAIAGANALMSGGVSSAGMSPALYFPTDQVAAAFAKGAVLVDGSAGRNYMIHASRREKPGLAEVHTLDTDVIYVQEGSATFVTGGTTVDAKTVEPNEIRGSSIQGGETRQITKGDVIVVPSGTPHWFKDVNAPMTYYVVKVR
jgi:glc operon protein GlcG